MVYQTTAGKWQATVIGKGGINSHLKISTDQDLLQEVGITTTHEVFGYQDELGKEWPGVYNIGLTCFANSIYKLIARCSGFDKVLSQDIEGGIHTALRNIVNGIRLGKRSALNEEVVNEKISKLLLDRLTIQSGKVFNNRNQHDSAEFLIAIINLLYPEILNTNSEIEPLINKAKLDNPFASIMKNLNTQNLTYNTNPVKISLNFSLKIILPPQFYIIQSQGDSEGNEIRMPDTLLVPFWDHQTNNKIGEKTYKRIALVHHICSVRESGHYIAYVNFGVHGWYKHDDSWGYPVAPLNSVKTYNLLVLYELQD